MSRDGPGTVPDAPALVCQAATVSRSACSVSSVVGWAVFATRSHQPRSWPSASLTYSLSLP